MPRTVRSALGGLVYHVLNRANARVRLFNAASDYDAFERVLEAAHERVNMRTVAYCVMPNHWHMVVWPREDRDLSAFMRWLTLRHTQRWHTAHGTVGAGHLYQGRFKSFAVQSDDHLLKICRYVEQNPLRAGLVRRAEDWRWSSLWRRVCGNPVQKALLSEEPVTWPPNWLEIVNDLQAPHDLDSIRRCVRRGLPFGTQLWADAAVRRTGKGSDPLTT